MEARYYGYCSVVPGTRLTVTRWFLSPAKHIVLLEFMDAHGVRWIGPEYPLDLAAAGSMDVHTEKRTFNVVETTIDSIKGWTAFMVDEKP